MRVIAGDYGSRRLKAVPGTNTRPTTDKIKEGMFNMLGGFFSGGVCLDLYGGSGALAIEAVSRGMDGAVITEKNRQALMTIQQNVATTKEVERFSILGGDNRKSLAELKKGTADLQFELVFIDPPYHQQKIEEDIVWLDEANLLSDQAVILCETDSHTVLPTTIKEWQLYKEKAYGQTSVRLYHRGGRH